MMAINESDISEKIFKTMKAYGLELALFTADGKQTVDPSEARRFYSKNKNILVNLDVTDERHRIKVNIGKRIKIQDIRPMLDSMRQLANQNAVLYTLRTFGRDISPKDFAYQSVNKDQIAESFSKAYGTVKTSRQRFENATLYIRHSKRVDEEIRGSRSRNIHAIFVENNLGERFRFPYTNLIAARSMTVHVSEGGTPYDNIGKKIISLAEEVQSLRNFKKKNKELAESQKLFYSSLSERVNQIQTQMSKMATRQGYRNNIESFIEQNKVDEIDDSIFETFGITFTEDDNKSYVYNIAKKITEEREQEQRISDFVNQTINSNTFSVTQPIDVSDNPDKMSYDDDRSMLSAWFGYLSQIASDADQSQKLSQLSDDIYRVNEKHLELSKKLLTALKKIAIVQEQSRNPEGLTESISNKMINNITRLCGEYFH